MEMNQNNTKKTLGIVAFGVILYWALNNWSILSGTLGLLLGLLAPFLLGACMAFILNVPMQFIENLLFSKGRNRASHKNGYQRPVSILLTIVVVLAVIFFVLFLVLPELGKSMGMLRDRVPAFLIQLQIWSDDWLKRYPEFTQWLAAVDFNWDNVIKTGFGFLQMGANRVLSSTVTIAASVFSGLVTFFLGFVFAIYILVQKENLGRQTKKLLYAYLPEAKVDWLVSIGNLSSKTFSNFLSGQCTEAVILGFLFYIAMTIFRFEYSLMISVLVGFTALIPIFGAFIGCVIGAFMILMVSPAKAFGFIVVFLVIQQLEGNFIYPRVVGNSVGLPSIWVLLAVTVGASTMGVAGMLINIPLFSVIYTLLREAVNKRLEKRKISRTKIC